MRLGNLMVFGLRSACIWDATVKKDSLHTSFQSKEVACEVDLSPANKDRGHVLDAGNIASTAARHTSVMKVADKAVRQARSRRGLIGAAASTDPFHVFIVFVGAVIVKGFYKSKSTQT